MPRQMFVPPISTVLMLAEPWTFPLFFEHRNSAMLTSIFNATGNTYTPQFSWRSSYDFPGPKDFERIGLLVQRPRQLTDEERVDAPSTYEAGHKLDYISITLPAGIMLSVFRIYIRRGVSGFDSVTFTALKPKPPKKPTKKATDGERELYQRLVDSYNERSKYVGKFWAKLQDVNEMMIEVVA